jgi:predicted nucleotidyltransferase
MNNPAYAQSLGNVIREEFDKLGLFLEKVLLFGSRVTGIERLDSDWDFLAISRDVIEPAIKRKVITNIQRRFAFEYDVDADILVQPVSKIPEIASDKSRASFYALRDGISV